MSPRPVLAFVALTGSIAVLASCSSTSEAAAEGITVEHALGATVVPANPERVASVGWGNQDVALALGIAPVGADDQTWSMDGSDGLGLYDWTLDAIDELGAEEPEIFDTADGIDFEKIADTQPDVILAAYSGLTEEEYETLSEIAPTVAYPDIPWYTPWREAILLDSQALGQESEGEQLVADLEQLIADETADITSFEGKTAAFFYVNPVDTSIISIYATGDPRTAFLGDLGFDFPRLAIETSESDAFYADISAENADQLADVDVMVAYGDETLLTALQEDPLWGTVPAVQNGAVVTVGGGDSFSGSVTPTALSIPWMLEDYVAMLDDAASRVE